MKYHSTKVDVDPTQYSVDNRGCWYAVCPCGWRGELKHFDDAKADAKCHEESERKKQGGLF